MSSLDPFVGSPQSHYAAVAIVIAIIFVSIAILFGFDAMPLSQKFFFVMLIALLSVPGILLSLMQLTCLVTGAGNKNQHWWCSIYSWLMSGFIIVYSIIIIMVAVQRLTKNNNEYFYSADRTPSQPTLAATPLLNVDGYRWQGGQVGNGSSRVSVSFASYGRTNASVRVIAAGTNPTNTLSCYIQNYVYNNPTIYVHLSTPFTGTVQFQSQSGNTTSGTWINRSTINITNSTGFLINAGANI